jgi:hypothetical protein
VRALLGLHADYRVILDGKTLVTRRMDIEETGYRIRSLGVVVDGKNIDQYAKKPGAEIRVHGTLPFEPLEPVAVIMMLRAARLTNGDKLELIAMDGTDLYRGTIEVVGREELRSAMGTQQAIRLLCRGDRVNHFGQKVPEKAPRQATLWVSDDNYHLPLRVEAQTAYGTGQFELTSFEPGRRPLPMPQQLLGITTQHAATPAPPAAPLPTPPPTPQPAQPIVPPPSPN